MPQWETGWKNPAEAPWRGTRCEESMELKQPEGNRSQQVGEV